MKPVKSIVKAALIVYLVLSLLATLAVNLGDNDAEILAHKGVLTVIEYQPAYETPRREYGAMFYQHSPFCNACDVYLWMIEFQTDGSIRFHTDGFECFGMY